jgi:hypothetical protein
MSEILAVGPARDLDGPPPVAPLHSLLRTELLDEDGDRVGVVVDRDATRVLNGVNVYGYPTGCPSLWEPCSDGTFRTKSDVSEELITRFDAFVVYKPITCSAIGMGTEAMEEFARRADRVLEATESAGVEEALAAGVETSSNPFFGDVNVDVLNGGTAVSAGVGLSFLEEAIGLTCRGGMIHATPAVVAALQAFPLGEEENPRLVTANGTPVVSGQGYQDVDTPWLASPGTTEDWVFATGPVQVHLGPLVTTSIRETLDRSDNTVTFRAERYVLAAWDTALQAAVLVDWSL